MRKHKSPVKAAKQALKRNERNTAYKSAVATATKRVLAAVSSGDKAQAEKALRETQSLIDSASTKKVLHHRNSARRISRVAGAVARMGK